MFYSSLLISRGDWEEWDISTYCKCYYSFYGVSTFISKAEISFILSRKSSIYKFSLYYGANVYWVIITTSF